MSLTSQHALICLSCTLSNDLSALLKYKLLEGSYLFCIVGYLKLKSNWASQMHRVNIYKEKNECQLVVVGVVRMSFYIGENQLGFPGLYRRKPFNSFPYLFPYLLLIGLLCMSVLQSVPPLSLFSFSSLIEVHWRSKNCIYFRHTM